MAKYHVKYNGHNLEAVHKFLSGCEGTGKCHFVKVIYNAISKTLLSHCKDSLLGPTGISSGNISRTAIHSGLGITPGTKLLGFTLKRLRQSV